MPLDVQRVSHRFDWAASPTVPANLTLHADTPLVVAAWREGLIRAYDPGQHRRLAGMVAWGEMMRALMKAGLKMCGAHMLEPR